jgi:hypothetical protein
MQGWYADVFCRRSLPPNYSTLSFLSFVAQLVESDLSTCQAVFQVGFLDVLLCMYACNFSSGTHAVVGIHDILRSEILACGTAILVLLSHQPDILILIKKHPISVLWPKSNVLASLYWNQTSNRGAAWRRVAAVTVSQRVSSLGAVFRPLMSWENHNLTELVDAYVDLAEFSRRVIDLTLSTVSDLPVKCRGDSFGFAVAHESTILLRNFNWDALHVPPSYVSSTIRLDGTGNSSIEHG